MSGNAFQEYERWTATLTGEEKASLEALRGDEEAILSRFAAPMQFGTAGLRSTMDLGISRMNIYTVAQTTKGLSALILASGGKDRGVAISYDSRHRSEEFARTAARVLAHDGVKVYLFDGIRPTPELSFAILHLGCISGINITASHNPKEYNGYKVYWEDGAQLPPEHADRVSAAVAEIDPLSVPLADFDEAVASGAIRFLGGETDDAFLAAVQGSALSPALTKAWGNKLHLVYTPLHGTGYKLVPECLRRAGVTDLRVVEEQAIPDGSFPTVASPNPENDACFERAVELIRRENLPCSLIIASDPDADRIGVAVRGEDGVFRALHGNRIGALLIDYILRIRKETGNLPADGCAIRSIVSSPLFDAICDSHGVSHVSVLTGFKYIGEKIKQWESTGDHTFLFGYEESHGYLPGSYARDKDAIGASLLLTEMACYHISHGRSIADALRELDETYGYYRESGFSCAITGLDPMAIMGQRMASLRKDGLSEIAGVPVLRVRDYLSGVIRSVTGETASTEQPSSDVLYFELESGDAIAVRPSGTEPKIKVYLLVKGETEPHAAEKLTKYEAFMRGLMK
ncbi:MAG: phospho-sugar mutase [Oscillospiraceae bacterium]|nr:phospho-sugar mutase [Oscillospiraceae bacterium]